jgi:hypothetical protein
MTTENSAPPADPGSIVADMVVEIGEVFAGWGNAYDDPFGAHSRVEADGATVTVRHETADSPAVRITVERIA